MTALRLQALPSILTAFLLISVVGDAHADGGKFVGKLVLKMDDNGRDAILEDEFTFVDDNGVIWSVPVGAKVNGASIPRPLWSAIGGPWSGKYRSASVIHDYYCHTQRRPWKAVHKAFYDAMLAGGVSVEKAKVMYAAVSAFGPRWAGASPPAKYSEKKFRELKEFVEEEDPSLEAIERKADQVAINIPQIEAWEGNLNKSNASSFNKFMERNENKIVKIDVDVSPELLPSRDPETPNQCSIRLGVEGDDGTDYLVDCNYSRVGWRIKGCFTQEVSPGGRGFLENFLHRQPDGDVYLLGAKTVRVNR